MASLEDVYDSSRPVYEGILSLPVEIQAEILSHLSIDSLVLACNTCKLWEDIILNNNARFKAARYRVDGIHKLLSRTGGIIFQMKNDQIQGFQLSIFDPVSKTPRFIKISRCKFLEEEVWCNHQAKENPQWLVRSSFFVHRSPDEVRRGVNGPARSAYRDYMVLFGPLTKRKEGSFTIRELVRDAATAVQQDVGDHEFVDTNSGVSQRFFDEYGMDCASISVKSYGVIPIEWNVNSVDGLRRNYDIAV
ncbi:hypothetical protein H072_8038 [Dactylellina haptotyla CBS 200.50]|uniref:F-box domain-containing protein n=1 Tax=Dactylellina haptotyla (strain CBS 200.50) TaxID=1284197 RepID=S8BSN9_DACHA|nr:hypothetical protein H072_8038 [Dactylellina haptotyla CBS 200.50]